METQKNVILITNNYTYYLRILFFYIAYYTLLESQHYFNLFTFT